MSYVFKFEIADILLEIYLEHPIKITGGFIPFLSENTTSKDKIEIIIMDRDKLPEYSSEKLFKNIVFSVHEDKDSFIRTYFDHFEDDRVYAVGKIVSDTKEEIIYLRGYDKFFSESHNTFSHIALEELLIRHDAMMLHSSFIKTQFGGVLFSGPSGIGKSTQADLWECNENARIINGDKSILRKIDGNWKAYGSPYAGSSRYFVNESSDLAAIVVLGKSEKCSIKELDKAEAFRKLYSQMIINTWNSEYIIHISDMVEDLIKETKVYYLECTPDIFAVKLLYETLKEGHIDENR